jgi:hypothetical protein
MLACCFISVEGSQRGRSLLTIREELPFLLIANDDSMLHVASSIPSLWTPASQIGDRGKLNSKITSFIEQVAP